MYCKIFTDQRVYDGMTDMSIACDNVFVTDGWICLYKDEKFVASFDMVTINGWVLIDSTADTPQTERIKTHDYCDICNHKGCDNCIANNLDDYCVPSGYAPKDTPQTEEQRKVQEAEHRMANIIADMTPQTDCGWK